MRVIPLAARPNPPATVVKINARLHQSLFKLACFDLIFVLSVVVKKVDVKIAVLVAGEEPGDREAFCWNK